MENQQPSANVQPTGPVEHRGNLITNFADWRFQHYLTMQLLPWFYLLLVTGALVVIGGIVGIAFYFSTLAGIIAAGIAPLAFLVTIAVIRAALEYLVMFHRVMRIIERMDALPHQVTGLSERVDGITVHVDRIIDRVEDMHGTLMIVRPLLSPSRMWRSLFGRE